MMYYSSTGADIGPRGKVSSPLQDPAPGPQRDCAILILGPELLLVPSVEGKGRGGVGMQEAWGGTI